ncbi:PcfB family protein [Actinomyces wuliandei]|uniref:PcfB family protein n=1 Tax=Actinomyces wuliandei TaxID=2057743 RepID=UPI001119364F|nr:PcfB family protein [Actinomyces wuliandei]
MLADEGAQQTISVLIKLAYGAVSVSGSVTRLTSGALAQMMQLTSAGMSQARTHALETGQMSVKRLQRTSGGNLRAQEISPALLRSVKADLRRRGVSFAVEKGADGRSYVHFNGRDTDTIRHAMTQVGARLGARAVQRTQSRPTQGRSLEDSKPLTKQQVLDRIRDRQRSLTKAPRPTTPTPRHTRTRGAL